MVGVNGVGKTTSIGKLIAITQEGKKVMLAQVILRAGAINQLQVWGDRVGVDVVNKQKVLIQQR